MSFEAISIIGKTGAIYYIVFFFSLYKYVHSYRRGKDRRFLFRKDIEYYWGILLSPSFSLIVTYWIMKGYAPFYRIHAGYLIVFITSGVIASDAIIRKRIRDSIEYNREAFFFNFIIVAVLYGLDSIFSIYQVFECDKRCVYVSDIFGTQDRMNIITFMSYGWLSAAIIICTLMIAVGKMGCREQNPIGR